MALERFMAVRFPLKMTLHNGCNAHKVFTVLTVVGVIIALIYMPQLWTNHTAVRQKTIQCQVIRMIMMMMMRMTALGW